MNNYTTLYSGRLAFYKNDKELTAGVMNFYAGFISDKCRTRKIEISAGKQAMSGLVFRQQNISLN